MFTLGFPFSFSFGRVNLTYIVGILKGKIATKRLPMVSMSFKWKYKEQLPYFLQSLRKLLYFQLHWSASMPWYWHYIRHQHDLIYEGDGDIYLVKLLFQPASAHCNQYGLIPSAIQIILLLNLTGNQQKQCDHYSVGIFIRLQVFALGSAKKQESCQEFSGWQVFWGL